jgi:ketopantoate reductase
VRLACAYVGAEFTVPWTVVTDPRTVQEVDALVVAVKAYDTASALAGLRHLRVQRVFSVQNGLLKHEQRASAFGAQKTIGAACRFASEVPASGAVRSTLERECYLGPLPGQEVTPAQTLGHTLRLAGLQAGYAERMHTNRLHVFRTANTAHLGRGIGQEQWLRVGPSEKYVAR